VIAVVSPARGYAPGIDWGRIVLVPVFVLLLLVNVAAAVTVLRERQGAAAAAGLLASGLTISFYVLVIAAYLRRGEASATTESSVARAAAVLGTAAPVVLMFVGAGRDVSLTSDLVASALMVAGLGLSVWSLRALGTNLSVIAQVRALAASGPYRWVRHPLYVGEIITVLGIVVRSPGAAGVAVWVALVLLQAYRAVAEERLLAARHSGYSEYMCGTARFLPGIV
jgi:protein-S-isoprenylcysteine O-methyltransferase Ste14